MPRSRPRPQHVNTQTFSFSDLARDALDVSAAPTTYYANYAQVSVIGSNEVYVDFYRVEPGKGDPSQDVHAVFLNRTIIPINMAKGFTASIANLIANYEKNTGQTLPNQRPPAPTDIKDIWE